MSIKKINIIVEDESISKAASGYRQMRGRREKSAAMRTKKPLTIGRDPWKFFAAAAKGTLPIAMRFWKEFIQRNTSKSIEVSDFDVFNLEDMDNLEKLFFKIMAPSLTVDRKGGAIPQFKIDRGFAEFFKDYSSRKIGPVAIKEAEKKLVTEFKDELRDSGFEEELFGDQMERRLHHSSSREEALFSPFYNSKYPKILTFTDFSRHFRDQSRYKFVIQAIETLKRAKNTQEQYDEYIGHAWTSFFVVVGISLPTASSASIGTIVLHEIGLFLGEEALRAIVLDDNKDLYNTVIDEYRTTNRNLVKICESIDKQISEYSANCVKTEKDCPEIREKINKDIIIVEETVREHFNTVFSQLNKSTGGFRKDKVNLDAQKRIVSLSFSSAMKLEKPSENLEKWISQTNFKIKKIKQMTNSLKQGNIAKIASKLESEERGSASEKWVQDAKELVDELTKPETIKEQNEATGQVEKLQRNYQRNFDNNGAKIISRFYNAVWADFFLTSGKGKRVINAEIKRQKNFLLQRALKHVGLTLAVDKKLNDAQIRETKAAVSNFFNNAVEEFYIDLYGDGSKSSQGKIDLPRTFIKLRGQPGIYVLYAHRDSDDPYLSLFHHVFDIFVAVGNASGARLTAAKFVAECKNQIKIKHKTVNQDVNFGTYKEAMKDLATRAKNKSDDVNGVYPNYITNDNNKTTEVANKFKYYLEKFATIPLDINNKTKGNKVADLALALYVAEALVNKASYRVKKSNPRGLEPYRLRALKEQSSKNLFDYSDLSETVREVMKASSGKLLTEQEMVDVSAFSNGYGLGGSGFKVVPNPKPGTKPEGGDDEETTDPDANGDPEKKEDPKKVAADKTVEKPAVKPTVKPADKTVEKPTEKPPALDGQEEEIVMGYKIIDRVKVEEYTEYDPSTASFEKGSKYILRYKDKDGNTITKRVAVRGVKPGKLKGEVDNIEVGAKLSEIPGLGYDHSKKQIVGKPESIKFSTK